MARTSTTTVSADIREIRFEVEFATKQNNNIYCPITKRNYRGRWEIANVRNRVPKKKFQGMHDLPDLPGHVVRFNGDRKTVSILDPLNHPAQRELLAVWTDFFGQGPDEGNVIELADDHRVAIAEFLRDRRPDKDTVIELADDIDQLKRWAYWSRRWLDDHSVILVSGCIPEMNVIKALPGRLLEMNDVEALPNTGGLRTELECDFERLWTLILITRGEFLQYASSTLIEVNVLSKRIVDAADKAGRIAMIDSLPPGHGPLRLPAHESEDGILVTNDDERFSMWRNGVGEVIWALTPLRPASFRFNQDMAEKEEVIDESSPKQLNTADGPFDTDGFRFAGIEVRFGRAAKQLLLVLALWDSESSRPAEPRSLQEVISHVWGENNDTQDPAFRQLCTETRKRLQFAGCQLDIQNMNGKVQLIPLSRRK